MLLLGMSVASGSSLCRSRASLRRFTPPARLHRLHLKIAAVPNRSFDEDELDPSAAAEFQKFAQKDPERLQQLAQHLDLLWKVSSRKRPEQCESCNGQREKECTWCNGTGVMTIGDTLYCNTEGCRPCPVCRGVGLCKCEHCRGTGRRAGWMEASGAS